TPAAIAPVDFVYRGFVLARSPIAMPAQTWWAKVAVEGGTGYLFATDETAATWCDRARALFRCDATFADYVDTPRGIYRVAAFRDGRLEGCVFVGPAENSSHWNTVVTLFAAETLTEIERRMLLSGRSSAGHSEIGPLVCACFGVGLIAIRNAII